MPCSSKPRESMIGSLPRFAPLETMPARYAIASACSSATVRAAVRLLSASKPPIFSFRVTNSSAEIAPESSAFSPYCTPTLSSVVRARTLPGVRPTVVPHTAVDRSASPQRVPFGLVTGS
jgi:hypothetical protein